MVCVGTHCARDTAVVELGVDSVLLKRGERSLAVSTLCPRFVLAGRSVGGVESGTIGGDITSGRPVTVSFAPIRLKTGGSLDVSLSLQWSREESILRKWARYRLTGSDTPVLLEEVVFDELDRSKGAVLAPEQAVIQLVWSYPVLLEGFFVGVEFPVASTRIDGERAIVAHQPGIRLQPGTWYETRKAVYGVADAGKERERFRSYIMAHNAGGLRRMFVWEPWVVVPFKYTETDHAQVMKAIHDKLLTRHGVSIDACVLTAGWSDPESIYELDKERFPGGFDGIRTTSIESGCPPGFWVSPCAYYPFALDTNWAKDQGYETIRLSDVQRVACIGGSRYQSELKKRVVEMFGKHGMTYAYFDGYSPTCSETNHGHEPGILSAEPLAEKMIDVFQSCRAARPDVWLEATCFGGNTSPWWLFHVDTVLGNYGDDFPHGRVPSPVYRESQITGRDCANLQGCNYSVVPVPLQEVFGGILNHTPEPIVNAAVMGLMRGNMLYMIGLDPSLMSDHGWAGLAGVIKWARKNTEALANTQPLLPSAWSGGKCPKFSYDAQMPREAYGYAHWTAGEGIVALRNPWIEPTSYTLELGRDTGLDPSATGLCAVSLFPENRTYGARLKYGDKLEVPLRPYEIVVLQVGRRPRKIKLPDASGELPQAVTSKLVRSSVSRLEFGACDSVIGDNWTCLVGSVESAIRMDLEANVAVETPEGELLVLLEEKALPVSPLCTIRVNGKEVPFTITGPDTGFQLESHARPEQWLFLRSALSQGQNRVEIELTTRTQSPTLSVWALAKKDGTVGGSSYPNSLPQPEEISVDAVEVIPAIDGASPSLTSARSKRPCMQLDGIFLDAVTPKSTEGVMLRNMSAGKGAMLIAGRSFARGLGVGAPSRIHYGADGKYSRFQSWVGINGGSSCFDRTTVVFEVWADGKKLWNSNKMTRWDDPVFADVDISGAEEIELVTLDMMEKKHVDRANWADWAEARLLH